MTRVIPIEDVRYTPAVAVLECGDDAPVSVYVTEFERGDGTPLHLHPYPEVFLVERNAALFTAAAAEITVTAGDFSIRPAATPHRHVGAGAHPVRGVSVHPTPEVEQKTP